MPNCVEPCCSPESTKALSNMDGTPKSVNTWLNSDDFLIDIKRNLILEHKNDSDEGFDTCITLDASRVGSPLEGVSSNCIHYYNSEGKMCEPTPSSYFSPTAFGVHPSCQASDNDCIKPSICDCNVSDNSLNHEYLPTDCEGDGANCGTRETCSQTLSHSSHPAGGQIGIGTDNRNEVDTCNMTLTTGNKQCENLYEVKDGKGFVCGGNRGVCTSRSTSRSQNSYRCLLPETKCNTLYNNCAQEHTNTKGCLDCIKNITDCDRTRFDLPDVDTLCNVSSAGLLESINCSWRIDPEDKVEVPVYLSGTDMCFTLHEAQEECKANPESPWCDDDLNDKFGCDEFRNKGNSLISDGKGQFYPEDSNCNSFNSPGTNQQCVRPLDTRGVDWRNAPPVELDNNGIGSSFTITEGIQCQTGYKPEPSAANTTTCSKDGMPYIIDACNEYNSEVCDPDGTKEQTLIRDMLDLFPSVPTNDDGEIQYDRIPCSLQIAANMVTNYCEITGEIETASCSNCCDAVFTPYWDRCGPTILNTASPDLTTNLDRFKDICDNR